MVGPLNPAAGVKVNDPSGLSTKEPVCDSGGVTSTAVSGPNTSWAASLPSTPGAGTVSPAGGTVNGPSLTADGRWAWNAPASYSPADGRPKNR